jgi:recombination protein RecR
VFHLLKVTQKDCDDLAAAITEVKKRIHHCSICYNVAETDPCPVCADERRERSVICVVERPSDVVAVEKAGSYKGVYHVLMGKISPLDGVTPEQLRVKELFARVKCAGIKEVIIATGSDVEGEATALYLVRQLKQLKIKTTRIAHGLPMGSSLDYSDEVTISRALNGRREV